MYCKNSVAIWNLNMSYYISARQLKNLDKRFEKAIAMAKENQDEVYARDLKNAWDALVTLRKGMHNAFCYRKKTMHLANNFATEDDFDEYDRKIFKPKNEIRNE